MDEQINYDDENFERAWCSLPGHEHGPVEIARVKRGEELPFAADCAMHGRVRARRDPAYRDTDDD